MSAISIALSKNDSRGSCLYHGRHFAVRAIAYARAEGFGLTNLRIEHCPDTNRTFGTWKSQVQILSPRPLNCRSVPVTWVTFYTGDIGNTLASNGFWAHSTRPNSASK